MNSNWSYSPETAKLGYDLCDLDLWPMTLTFCMDITSVIGNNSDRQTYRLSIQKFKIQKGLLKHIHIYSNRTQYDSTKMFTNIKHPL